MSTNEDWKRNSEDFTQYGKQMADGPKIIVFSSGLL